MSQWKEGDHDRRGPQRWRLDKEISLGDILTICFAALALFGAYSTLDKRVQSLEERATFQRAVDVRQDEDSIRYQQRIDESLREINRKLDRLVEAKR